jgi:hypothetical protein
MKINICLTNSLKFFSVVLISGVLITACSSDAREAAERTDSVSDADAPINTLTDEEIEEGWVLLFDGESTDGWRGYNRDSFPEDGWIIEDEVLRVVADRRGGDIIYDEKFRDFRFSVEWKVSEGGNSGIFYLAQEIEDTPIWQSAPEMQILDNEGHPDAGRGRDGDRKAGALYDLIPATPQNSKPAGEWNHAEVLVYRGTVVHFQNGEPVVEYQLDSPAWEEMVANSKFAGLEHFGKYEPGYIGLQDHGDDIWFRNIKIRKID